MGEARKPGPHAGFDNGSDEAWSEYSDHSQVEAEQPEDWVLPPTEMEAAMEELELGNSAAETGVEVVSKVRDVWSDLHANDTFAPTKIKRVAKLSKFDGAKPGWVFKTGDQGLGYYRDSGGLRTQLSLDLALHQLRSLPVATISLDGLVTSSHARDPGGSGSDYGRHPPGRGPGGSGHGGSSGEQPLAPANKEASPRLREPRGIRPDACGSKHTVWKLAAQAAAVYLGANRGIHSAAANPTDRMPPTTRAGRQTLCIYDVVAHSLPGFSPPPGLFHGLNESCYYV